MNAAANARAANADAFFKLVRNPVKFRFFLLKQLPAAFFAGLRIEESGEETCSVSVPFKWFTKNPFRSTYFACLSMAAEMSTGLLAMAQVFRRSPAVSLLVVAVEGKFYKKATGRTSFVCTEGARIMAAVQEAVDLRESQSVSVLSSGYNGQGELIAEFRITWSFRAR